jgi:hypothetical protein
MSPDDILEDFINGAITWDQPPGAAPKSKTNCPGLKILNLVWISKSF